MAEKILNTRIALKIDTLENWSKSTIGLKKGELALATVASTAGSGLVEPVIMIKVGEDGVKTFSQLDWNVYAKASDVLAVCKNETDLTAFINGVIANSNLASNSAFTALSGRMDAAEGNITSLTERMDAVEESVSDNADAIAALQGLVGNTKVADQITAAIDALASVYETKTDASAKLSEAKTYADGLNAAMDARVQGVEGKAHTHTFVESELNKIAEGDVAKWNAAEQNAKDYATSLDTAMDARVDALEEKFGDGEGTVEAQIEAEAAAREAADDALSARIKVVEDDYLKASDKEALQTQINTIMNNPDAEGAINSINEFTQYVTDHGTIADGFRSDIDANADAIEAIQKDYLKATDKTELQGNIDAVADKVTTAEGKITGLESSVATKATQSDLDAVSGRVTTVEGKVTTLEGEMDTAQADIEALETKVGNDTVENQINAAITALKIGDYAKAADLAAAIARIAQNETDIASLSGRMDAAEDNIESLEIEVAKKANDSELAAIAKTGNVNDLIQSDRDVLVFDCGTSV